MVDDRDPNPLKIENPEFECHAPHEFGLEAEIQISDPSSGDKFTRYSTLTFRTDNTGGYPMKIALRLDNNKKWFRQDDINEISIQIAGDYEADVLKQFFQHAGLMMLPVYGNTVQAVDDIIAGRNPND
jgi:hypothetical protein